MRVTFSWDDGAVEDLKLFELHRKYGIPGMFFVPTINSEGRDVISERDIRANCSDLIKFGGHTLNHKYLTEVDIAEVENELIANKEYLERATGEEIIHFCLPGGKYNKQILKKVFASFETCRTADTMNIRNRGRLIKPTIHFYDRGKKSLILNSLRHCNFSSALFFLKNRKTDYFELIKKYISSMSNKNVTIIIWGHSWEIENLKLWGELESLFDYISNRFRNSICSYSDMCNETL